MFGMSCSGKTTFALQIETHNYFSFDYLFDWYSTETLGLSTSKGLEGAAEIVSKRPPFVLDGWHLSDKEGKYLPSGITVYVVYADYERIIDQYRVEVKHQEEHRHMFKKWYYEVPYDLMPKVRYFCNNGEFVEQSQENFQEFLKVNQ